MFTVADKQVNPSQPHQQQQHEAEYPQVAVDFNK